MELRLATMEDYDIFNEMYIKFVNLSNFDSMEKWRYKHFLDLESLYFAVEEGKVIGYAIVYAFSDHTANITQFFVKEKRKGHGTQFYHLLEKEIKSYDLNKIFLRVFWDEAECFWTKMGFKSKDGTEDFYKCI